MKAVEDVFHDEQLVIWSDDVADAIQPWLKDFDSYDDKVQFFEALKSELLAIGEVAFALASK